MEQDYEYRLRFTPYGDQPLYKVQVELLDEYGTVLETITKRIGLRTLTISQEKDLWGKEFAFCVNGVKIFAMGGNYIPEDCIYSRITPEVQKYLLESCKRANFNCVRVWGGGYLETYTLPEDRNLFLCDGKASALRTGQCPTMAYLQQMFRYPTSFETAVCLPAAAGEAIRYGVEHFRHQGICIAIYWQLNDCWRWLPGLPSIIPTLEGASLLCQALFRAGVALLL